MMTKYGEWMSMRLWILAAFVALPVGVVTQAGAERSESTPTAESIRLASRPSPAAIARASLSAA